MKKLLGIMALIFVLTGAFTVYGEGGSALLLSSGVEYSVLQTAINNAQVGDTVKLLKDTAANITVASAQNITLDLNGHKLESKTDGASVITNNGTLTITDSSTDKNGKITGGSAENGGGIYNSANATLTINAGAITGNTASQCGGGIYNAAGATLNVSEGTITGNTSTGKGGGIYSVNVSNVNLISCVISGNKAGYGAGVYGEACNVSITGGSITGNTAISCGGGLYLNDCKSVLDSAAVTGNICSGIYSTSGAYIIGGEIKLNGNVNITGNVFSGNKGNLCVTQSADVIVGSLGEAASIGVTLFNEGESDTGAFTKSVADKTAYKGENYTDANLNQVKYFTPDKTDDDYSIYRISLDNDNRLCVVNAVCFTDADGDKEYDADTDNYYGSAGDAVSAAPVNESTNIVMINNSADYISVAENQNITIDLNGYKLEQSQTNLIVNKGTLTIKDTSSAGSGKIQGDEAYYGSLILNSDNGSLTIDGGTITGGLAQSGAAIYIGGGSVTMNGGAISGNGRYSSQITKYGGAVYISSGSFTMTAGTITGNYADFGAAICASNCTLNINGGSITNNTATSYGGGIDANSCSVSLSNCTVADNTSSGNYLSGGVYTYNGSISVSGNVCITGNTTKGANANLCINDSSSAERLTFSNMSDTASIGITKLHGGTENTGAFTANKNCTLADVKYFTADNTGYKTGLGTDGRIHIVNPVCFIDADKDGVYDAGEDNYYSFISYAISAAVDNVETKIVLVNDTTTNITIYNNDNIILDLNGKTINASQSSYSTVDNRGTLTITDSSADNTGAIKGYDNFYHSLVTNSGTLTIEGGTITGGNANDGAGLNITGGLVTMTGGSITGNNGLNGTGVYLGGGSFTMTGGSITGNTCRSTGNGGGVYFAGGTLTLGGTAVIKDNAINNLYIKEADTTPDPDVTNLITISSTGFNTGACVYVTMENTSGQFTGNGTSTDVGYFKSDNTDYLVAYHPADVSYLEIINPVCYIENGTTEESKKVYTSGEDIYFASIGEAVSAASGSETTIVMCKDSVENISVYLKNIVLDLNGHTLKGKEYEKPVISVANTGMTETCLKIKDSGTTGKIIGKGTSVIYNEGVLYVLGGTITGGSADKGGGIYSSDSSQAKLYISGGTITGNTAKSGAGVYCRSLTMTAGNITGNTAKGEASGNYGGGIYSTLGPSYISGGTISGNKAADTGYGGGIYCGGILYISDTAVISGNTARYGGGLCVSNYIENEENIAAVISGGTICGNTADMSGGGIYLGNGVLTVKGGVIGGTEESDANTASYTGGGIYVNSGTMSVTLNLGGTGVVSGNAGSNIYLMSERYITLLSSTEAPAQGSDFGVTLATTTGRISTNGTASDATHVFSDSNDYSVLYNTKGYLEIIKPVCYIENGTDNIYTSGEDAAFMSITEAIDSAQDNTETIVVLLTDIEENIIVKNKDNIVLDLYGHVLKGVSGVEQSVIVVNEKGVLTVKDTSAGVVHKFSVGSNYLWSLDSEGTKTLEGGCITGGTYTGNSGYGGAVQNAGTFTLESGNIVGNKGGYGGGVYNAGGATFNMEGGTIAGNLASYNAGNGGGVNNNGGAFNLTGGIITENKCGPSGKGGGVYSVSYMSCGGNPVVYGNYSTNVYLTSANITINTSQPLYGEAKIGIFMLSSPRVFTTNGEISDIKYFVSDNENYSVVINKGKSSNYLELMNPVCYIETGDDGVYTPLEDKYYESLSDAEYAAANHTWTKIVLCKDHTESFSVWSGKKIILDLAGYTLTGKYSDSSTITNYNYLIIKDSGNTGKIVGNNASVIKNIEVGSNNGDLTIEGGTITGGSAEKGGGIYSASGCYLTINGGNITGNTARYEGGGIYSEGRLTVGGTALISDNIAEDTNVPSKGGGIYSGGSTVNINGGTISSNKADYGAGVYIAENSKLTMTSGTICENGTDSCQGGGIYNLSKQDNVISGGTIGGEENADGNFGMIGGGIFNSGKLTISDSALITRNITSLEGGGVFNDGDDTVLNISGATIKANFSDDGAGLYNQGTVNMTGGSIKGNCSNKNGGGIYNFIGTVTVSNGDITGNVAGITETESCGGGIYNLAQVVLNEGAKVDANTAYDGGGIYNGTGSGKDELGILTMNGGQILSNTAINNGGGIYNGGDGDDIYGGVISANGAVLGGGIYSDSYLHLYDVQITGNTATKNGAGVYQTVSESEDVYYVQVGNTCVVTGNTVNMKENNVFLAGTNERHSLFLLTDGEYKPTNMKIGVSVEATPTKENPYLLTEGGTESERTMFFSDVADYCIKYIENGEVGELYLYPGINVGDCAVSDIQDVTYNGKEYTPEITVTYADNVLIEGEDYLIEYKNNKNAGEASIVITGLDCYTATKVVKFKINKKTVNLYSLSDYKVFDGTPLYNDAVFADKDKNSVDELFLSEIESIGATGSVTNVSDSPVVNTISYTFKEGFTEDNYDIRKSEGQLVITKNGELAVAGTSYTGVYDGKSHGEAADANISDGTKIFYSTDGGKTWSETVAAITDAGTVTVVAKAVNPNYDDALCTYKLCVTPKEIQLFNFVNEYTLSYIYTEAGAKPQAEVKDGDKVLTEGKDYQLIYSDNLSEGKATVQVVGIGNYSGSVKKTFDIKNINICSTSDLMNFTEKNAGKDAVTVVGEGTVLGLLDLYEVTMDGKTISAENYRAEQSCIKVTLYEDYLNTLKTGKHTFAIVLGGEYEGLEYSVNFKVLSEEMPDTGDSSMTFLWGGLFVLCGICVIVLLVVSKKRKHK